PSGYSPSLHFAQLPVFYSVTQQKYSFPSFVVVNISLEHIARTSRLVDARLKPSSFPLCEVPHLCWQSLVSISLLVFCSTSIIHTRVSSSLASLLLLVMQRWVFLTTGIMSTAMKVSPNAKNLRVSSWLDV